MCHQIYISLDTALLMETDQDPLKITIRTWKDTVKGTIIENN